MQLDLPSPDPNVAPPPGLRPPVPPLSRRASSFAAVARHAVEPRAPHHWKALPWIVVMLWMGSMLAGVYAEYLISKAFP